MIENKLNDYLKINNITKYSLSKKTGIDQNSIANIGNMVTAAISYETLNKLCKALECSVGDILEYFPDKE